MNGVKIMLDLDGLDDFMSDISSVLDTHEDKGVVTPNKEEVLRANTETPLEVFYRKLDKMGYNLVELKPIFQIYDRAMLVEAIAGSGKTTMLTLKIIHDMLSGDLMKTIDTPHGVQIIPARILVATFLNSGAKELKESMHEWVRKLGIKGLEIDRIEFCTIHAEVKHALTLMGVATPILMDTLPIIKKVMQDLHIRNVSVTSRAVTSDEVMDISGLLSFARNILDDKKYTHPLMEEYNLDCLTLDILLKEYKMRRSMTRELDFEDLQEMMLEGAKINPNVRDYLANRYDYVFVDEFQDTSQLQYELLKYYFNGAKRIVAVGDSDQSIYGFRGSDVNIIRHKFIEDYEPTICTLSTNYRCAGNFVDAIKPSISAAPDRMPKELHGVKPHGDLIMRYDSNINELIESIRVDLARGKDVGVLARVNNDLLGPAILLELEGITDFNTSGTLSLHSRLPKDVLGLLSLVTKRYNPDFEDLFKIFLKPFHFREAETLARLLQVNNKESLYTLPLRDIYKSLPNLAPMIEGLRKAKEQGEIFSYVYLLEYLLRYVYVTDSTYADKAKEFTYFIKSIILNHDKVKNLSIYELETLFHSTLPQAFKQHAKKDKGSIKLSTIHDAKGKEWDSVYIWNDLYNRFPNHVGKRPMTDAEYEEERRIHYIAFTRAKEKLTVYTRAGEESPFLLECDLSTAVYETPEYKVVKDLTINPSKATKGNDSTLNLAVVLAKYIDAHLSTGNMTEEVANIELVTRQIERNTLLGQLATHVEYLDNADEIFEYLPTFFSFTADSIFNEMNNA